MSLQRLMLDTLINDISQWAINAPNKDFYIATGLLIFFSIVGFIGSFSYLNQKRIMQDTPTSKIRSAAQGYVELKGNGHYLEGEMIEAPLSGKNCIWYQFSVQEYRRTGRDKDGKSKWDWVTIDSGLSDEVFLIKDETGECIIDPDGASVITKVKESWYGRSRDPKNSDTPSNVLFRINIGGFSFGRKKFRFEEQRIHSGEDLYSIGLFKTTGGADTKLNMTEDVRQIIKEWKSDSANLLEKFDTNKDGEIDVEEWQAIQDEAFNHVMEQHKDLRAKPRINIMSKTQDTRKPYILSAIPESQLIKQLNIYIALFLSMFFLFGIPAAVIITARALN
jgi:EF hand